LAIKVATFAAVAFYLLSSEDRFGMIEIQMSWGKFRAEKLHFGDKGGHFNVRCNTRMNRLFMSVQVVQSTINNYSHKFYTSL